MLRSASPRWASRSRDLARLEVEVWEERNPAIAERQWPRSTLHLKGATLRAQRRLARPQARDQPRRRRARAPGQAPPRQAPQAARARAAAAGRAAAGRRGWPRGGLSDRGAVGLYTEAYVDPRSRPPDLGEAKQFKQYEKRVDRINAWEPELELDSTTTSCASSSTRCASAPQQRRVARRPAARDVRARARGRQAHDGHAPLRRPADRRHGAARRHDRRDEDRRGQDADRHARRSSSTRSPARASTSSPSTTTSPAATPSG